MSCEKHKVALIDSAVTGAEPTPEFRSHVAACTSCAAELAQQRSLIAAIDANLHGQMNAPVPAALLLRLESRIAQQQSPPSLNLGWLYATAALAISAATIFFALSHQRTHKLNSHTATLAQTSQSTADHRPEIMTAVLQPATPQEIRRGQKQHARSTARPEPEVLVPPEERIALARFIADSHPREGMALALAKRVPEPREQNIAPVETLDIQIASLTVSPIRESTSTFTNSNK
jgi:anti-sigma factor RsiW